MTIKRKPSEMAARHIEQAANLLWQEGETVREQEVRFLLHALANHMTYGPCYLLQVAERLNTCASLFAKYRNVDESKGN